MVCKENRNLFNLKKVFHSIDINLRPINKVNKK